MTPGGHAPASGPAADAQRPPTGPGAPESGPPGAEQGGSDTGSAAAPSGTRWFVSTMLRRPGTRRVLAAEFTSSLGTQMTTLALPWFVLVTSGSPARTGLVFVLQIAPTLLLGLFSGALVARLGARRVMVAGDVIDAVLIAAIPVLHLAHALPFWALLLLVAGTGTVGAAYLPAQRLLLADTVGGQEAAGLAANALFETATSGARLIGPAVAGALIGVVGALNVIWIDAATFVLSALLLLRTADAPRTEAAPGDGRIDVLAGVRYIRRDVVMRRLCLAACGYGVVMPFLLLALPVLARARYGADPHVAGWLLAAWGGGTVAGTLLVATFAQAVPPIVFGSLAGVGVAVPLWFMPLGQPAATAALCVAATCAFMPGITAPAVTLVATRPPEGLRPYVLPVFAVAAMGPAPLAYAAAGLLYERYAPGAVLAGIAALATVCAVFLLSLVRHRDG